MLFISSPALVRAGSELRCVRELEKSAVVAAGDAASSLEIKGGCSSLTHERILESGCCYCARIVGMCEVGRSLSAANSVSE